MPQVVLKKSQEVLHVGGGKTTYAAGPCNVSDELATEWRAAGLGRRIWAKDPTVWFEEPVAEIADRLGWLDLPGAMAGQIEGIERSSALGRRVTSRALSATRK